MAFIITLWIGNGAVLKSSKSMAIKRILKMNNSWTKLFDFQILLIAIDWNF